MPTAAEEHSFLKPILAAFAQDGPRLIYADYLDESSQPDDVARAEFIRVQLALARIAWVFWGPERRITTLFR